MTGKLFDKVWQEMKNVTNVMGYTCHTSIWNNANCEELQKLEGFELWQKRAEIFGATVLE